VTDLLEPINDGKEDNCFISKSYDATSHFETAANDVLSLYKRITGLDFDLDSINADSTTNEDD
jgi:Rab GDP dissociation inhibitor